MENIYRLSVLTEYHSYGPSNNRCVPSPVVSTGRCKSLDLVNKEEELVHKCCFTTAQRKHRIAPALLEDDYRLQLKLQLSKGISLCTLLAVATNPTASYLDHLLFKAHNSDTSECKIRSRISPRLVFVTVKCDKESLTVGDDGATNISVTRNTIKDARHFGDKIDCSEIKRAAHIGAANIARNGFYYHGHRFQFLLSKDPKDKVAYFLRDESSNKLFPDANSVRKFIGDFTTLPTISRAGM